MSQLVTIKPKNGSRKFSTMGSMTNVYTETDPNGKITKEQKANFDGQRFPGSKPFFTISWSLNRKRWLLEGFEDNSEDLNKLVRKTKFQYEKPHKKSGEYIESADIFDPNDAFFNHRLCKKISAQGEALLDKDNALDNLILRGLKMNPKFAIGGEDNPLASSGARYIIVDKSIDTVQRKKARVQKLEIFKLYENLTSEKKLKVAMAMNLIPNEKIDQDVIDEVLFKAAEDNFTKVADSKFTRQELFIKLCNMESEELNLKHRIQKAKSLGILKRQANSGWLLLGSPVGKTMEQIEEYLKNDDHNDLLSRMEDALKNDKS